MSKETLKWNIHSNFYVTAKRTNKQNMNYQGRTLVYYGAQTNGILD